MKLTVKVRPQGNDSQTCTADPVANALRVAVGLPRVEAKDGRRSEAMAQPSRLFARGKQCMIKCETPPEVAEWIGKYDLTGEGEAFEFEVEALPVDVVQADWLIPGAGIWGSG